MAAAVYFGKIQPSEYEDMDVEVAAAIMERVMKFTNDDAEAKGDLVRAQTEAITSTVVNAAQMIAKSTGNAVMAVGRAMAAGR